MRTIGLVRARAKIGMQNLAYNMSRFGYLDRLATQLAQNGGVGKAYPKPKSGPATRSAKRSEPTE